MHVDWTRREVTLQLSLLLTLWCISAMAIASSCLGAERPNVLIFLIDDLGCRDLAIEGSRFHATPNLDRLLASGVRFSQFYSSHPVCSPTRASLMTGKAPHHHRITDWIRPASGVAIRSDEVTLAERFKDSGYQTAYLGKWHLGESDADQPTQHGFEWTKGVNRGGQPGSYYYPFHRPATQRQATERANAADRKEPTAQAANPTRRDTTAVPDFEDSSQDDYLTDVLSDAAIEYLTKHRDPKRPFLMCVGHYAVHTPIEPPHDLLVKYQEKGQRQFVSDTTQSVIAGDGFKSRGRQDHPGYAAMVENLDRNIGRILQTLDEQKLSQNTVVVFTSDNGGLCSLAGEQPGPTCNLPYRSGKGWTYEGGIRISTSISWPGKLAASICSTPACTADLYPTLLELCGLALDPKHPIDGMSLVQVMQGKDDAGLVERPMVWFYPHRHGSGHRPAAALRKGNWKLICWFEEDRCELYRLSDDVGELNDLAAQSPNKVIELKQLLDHELGSVQDLIPRPIRPVK